jgi:hypothetical protein
MVAVTAVLLLVPPKGLVLDRCDAEIRFLRVRP